jgi:TonB family protein
MPHGSQQYFRERAQFERRLSMTCACVSLVLLTLEGVFLLPALHGPLGRAFLSGPLGPRRFGFEGTEQYVRRITLELEGPPGPHPGRPTILYRSVRATKGGRPVGHTSTDPHARPDTRLPGTGPGESTEDLVARARVLYGGSSPVMRSEDLVVERLVKPDYPEDARDRNIEGRVALVALVDTTGAVARVELMSSTGERQLEEAATVAVRQCRFRPYRVDGKASEVYAVFRFSFRIY